MSACRPSSGCDPCSGRIDCDGKNSWPELLGKTGKEAKNTILKERCDVNVYYLDCGGIRIFDCCCNRVWLEVIPKGHGDYDNGTVCKVPTIG